MLWLNGSDKPVFENAYYRPNMRCYRFVLNSIEAMNTGRIGGFEEVLERPEYVVKVQQMLASGMTIHEAKTVSGLSQDEFKTVLAYIHHLEICRYVPVKDGKVLPQEKPMAYEKFKENYKG